MNYIAIILPLFLMLSNGVAVGANSQSTEQQDKYRAWARSIWDTLDRKHGKIKLNNGVATLNVPKSFYYLNPKDTETVLVQVWKNPPGASKNSLGMLFPSNSTPFDQGAWGVTIDYEQDGYVSDKDADKIDYNLLLTQMKESVKAANNERIRLGYEPIELKGWAAKPYYDKKSHKLHWAKEIKFGNQATNTLNYNIRVLGRKGVLVLNFIAGIDQKKLIDSKLNTVLAMANFNTGSRYEDFNPSIDKVAAYGIGALVAGKVIAKTGILVALIIFLKKFGIFILLAAGVFFKKLFTRNKV